MKLRIAVLIGGIVIFGAADAALLMLRHDWGACRVDDPDLRIVGCTTIIEAPFSSGADIARASYNRGLAFQQKGQLDRAIEDYDQAIKLTPIYAAAFNNRGSAYAKKGQYDRAAQDYDQAIKLSPGYFLNWLNRAELYLAEQQYDRGISDLDEAIRLNPSFAASFGDRALAYLCKGQYDRAMEDFDQALKLDPKNAKIASNRQAAVAAKQRIATPVAGEVAQGRTLPATRPSAEVAAEFAQSAPRYLEMLLSAPPAAVARSYFSEAYLIKSIRQFAGARQVVTLNGVAQTITQENADAYIKGYSDTLAIHGEIIRRRGFQQIGGTFTMKVGPNCQKNGINDGLVSIAQHDYDLEFDNGWPVRFVGLVVEDTIVIGAPDNNMPDVIGGGKVEADHVELNFSGCRVTLTRG